MCKYNKVTGLSLEHRGMAFTDSGRELGYLIIVCVTYINTRGYSQNEFEVFAEAMGQSMDVNVIGKSGTTPNGRKYKYYFTRKGGATMESGSSGNIPGRSRQWPYSMAALC